MYSAFVNKSAITVRFFKYQVTAPLAILKTYLVVDLQSSALA